MADSPRHSVDPIALSDDERGALIRLLRRTIDDDRYPLSPRLAPLRAILAKLDPPRLGLSCRRH